MRFTVKFMCIVISLLLFTLPVLSKKLTPIEIEKQLLEKKFKGFYKRIKEQKAYKKRRLKNVEQHKLQRKRYAEESEKIRKKFIKNRKKKKEVNIEALVAKDQKKRAKARNKIRLKYIQRKKVMAKLLQTTKKIPEDVNVGLRSLEDSKKK